MKATTIVNRLLEADDDDADALIANLAAPTHATVKANQLKVGDVISVNTGYRPLDDENCKILKIKQSTGLFGDPQIELLIKSYTGDHWYAVHPTNVLTVVL